MLGSQWADAGAILGALEEASATFWGGVLARALATAGPSGAGAPDATAAAIGLGLLDKVRGEGLARVGTLTGLRRAAGRSQAFAHVGGGKYALRVFPGITEVPRGTAGKVGGAGGRDDEERGASQVDGATDAT